MDGAYRTLGLLRLEDAPPEAVAIAEYALQVLKAVEHGDQPLFVAPDGLTRFRANPIVRFLLDAGPFDLNALAAMDFTDEARAQFAQLIGYSLRGYGELSYVSDEAWIRAEVAALGMLDAQADPGTP